MRHIRLVTLKAQTTTDGASTPFAVKMEFLENLVDRAVVFMFQKNGGAL